MDQSRRDALTALASAGVAVGEPVGTESPIGYPGSRTHGRGPR